MKRISKEAKRLLLRNTNFHTGRSRRWELIMKTKIAMKMETKQVVSQKVKAVFPQILIDYIWSLVYSVSDSKSTLQIFKLSENQLSGRAVQDIVHMAYDIGIRNTHRIFGIIPVNEEIHIIHDHARNEYHMSLD